jgi:hypothetical protein
VVTKRHNKRQSVMNCARRLVAPLALIVIAGALLTVASSAILRWIYTVQLESGSWGANWGTTVWLSPKWVGGRTTSVVGITHLSASRIPRGAIGFGGAPPPPLWSALRLDRTTRECRQVTETAVGWPFRAFAARWTDPPEFAQSLASDAWHGSTLFPTPFAPLIVLDDRAPTEMIPLGFAGNTLFWTGVSALGLLCVRAAVSRTAWARARQGLCMRCAYQLPDGYGEIRCPECGELQPAPRPSRTRAPAPITHSQPPSTTPTGPTES